MKISKEARDVKRFSDKNIINNIVNSSLLTLSQFLLQNSHERRTKAIEENQKYLEKPSLLIWKEKENEVNREEFWWKR